MSLTKRIVFAFIAAVILGIVLLFNFNVVAEGVAFLGHPLKMAVRYFFMVPFIYYAFGALFPNVVGRHSASAVMLTALGAVIYLVLSSISSSDWNSAFVAWDWFKLGAVLAGGLVVWLFSRAK